MFTTNIENVNSVILKEVQDVTMKTNKNYQINEIYIMKKNRDVLLAKSKINQKNRNYERKIYKQQVQELNQKL